MTDSIVQQVRDARASIAAGFGYDLSKYLAWIREQTKPRKESLGISKQNKTLETTDGGVEVFRGSEASCAPRPCLSSDVRQKK